ncbi:MAG: gliding motility-associated C-terminal domain-containing protein [Ginsengibacter sp.]
MKFILILLLSYISLPLNAQIITTVAGNGTYGYSGDGGPATSAQLAWNIGVAVDDSGNIYISDHDNDVIRKVNSAGIISTFAGNGTLGFSGDGGPATAARLYHPAWITIDNSGNFYFTDQNAEVIRKINTSGVISTITGNLPPGYSGDGGPLMAAQFRSISGIAFDQANNMYISDYGNNVVRKVDAAGIISTVAGNGTAGFSGDGGLATAAQLGSPYKVVFDSKGNMYIPDEGNSRIRKVTPAGIITTIAGDGNFGYSGDGGQATNAPLGYTWTIAIDNSDNIYAGDAGNYVVRKITPSGIISTYAGNGTYGNSGDNGPATAANLGEISGVAIDNAGNVFIAIRNYFFVVKKVNNCLTALISLQPADAALCNSGDTSFAIIATNATSYQWQVNAGSGFSNITDNITYSGSTSDTIKIKAAGPGMNNYKYRCIAANSCGNVYSSTATLYVAPPLTPSISIEVTRDTICAGSVATFTATSVNGGTVPAYQWMKNGINIATGNTWSATDIADGDVITCVLTSNNNCVTTNTATSNAIIMKVNAILTPSIYISASSDNICSGTPVKISSTVINGGTILYLQWQKNGINTGTDSPAYIDSTFKDGDVITCKLAPGYSCVSADTIISDGIIMKVMPLVVPSVTITASKTSICPGDSVTFNATPVNGGASPVYQWSKNEVSVGFNNSSYTDASFSDGDIVNCAVTSDAACVASPSAVSNSIQIAVFQNPSITLDKTPTLCSGASRQLDAGNFDAYLWNNGTTSRTLPVSNTGTYYVVVTDKNGCKGSDTTVINEILPLPKNFIPKDTSICSYGTITLSAPGSFKNYLWSNHSNASFITVNQPGAYSLQVTDYNLCTATETVVVTPKQCMAGFYIPNAFSPNNDGRNDVFKPMIFGNVIRYSFVIYNRWGQKVFESNDLLKGWNGTFHGANPDADIFVWICSYQFDGGSVENKKGTVVLVR